LVRQGKSFWATARYLSRDVFAAFALAIAIGSLSIIVLQMLGGLIVTDAVQLFPGTLWSGVAWIVRAWVAALTDIMYPALLLAVFADVALAIDGGGSLRRAWSVPMNPNEPAHRLRLIATRTTVMSTFGMAMFFLACVAIRFGMPMIFRH
jgi:hypothetical protein